ncbi:MAG: O-antigen ligase family protein [Candidatus Marinimicrobia bacterium]|nr:O-antigen ligase family protein [Candidatus Neomarinimicrobiota bacterium]
MAREIRFSIGPFLLYGTQAVALASTVIHPLMPLVLMVAGISAVFLFYFPQILLVLLATVALIKGALITQFPLLESVDFSVVLSSLVLLVLLWRLTDPKMRFHIGHYRNIMAAFVGWVLWMIMTSIYAPHLEAAMVKGLRFAFFTSVLFFGPLVFIKTREESRIVLKLFFAGGLLGALYLLGYLAVSVITRQSLLGLTRLTILTSNPIAAGRVLSISAAMAAAMLITNRDKMLQWGLLMVVLLIAVLFTGSRGPMLSFVVATFLVGILSGRKAFRRSVNLGFGLLLVFMVVLILLPRELILRFGVDLPDEIARTNRGIGAFNTVTHRFHLWDMAIALWTKDLQHFLFGAGSASYGMLFPWRDFRYPHNLPLEILAEYGLIGLGMFSIHFLSIVKRVALKLRSGLQNEELLWLTAALTMALATMTSGDLNDNRMLWFFLGGLLATMNVDQRLQGNSNLV